MKVKEFLKDHNIDLETEDDCNLCRLHDLFTLKIPNLCCPKCGHPIDFLDGDTG